MIENRDILKSYFEPGDKPSHAHYANVIDSLLHREQDKAPAVKPVDVDNDTLFVTPKTAALIVESIAVKTVNNIAPDDNGNVAVTNITGSAATITGTVAVSQVSGLQQDLDAKVSSNNLKTVNGQSLTGSGNITVTTGQKKIISVPAAPYTIPGTSPAVAFPAGCDVIPLEADKTYFFKGKYYIANGTSHTISIGWSVDRLAITSMEYYARLFSSNLNAYATALTQTQVSGIGIKVLNSSTASPTSSIEFEGVIRCTSGGTITPLIAFSTPASTPLSTMKVGSFLEFTEIGDNTVTFIQT
jgi:hypothetical protein